MCSTIATVVKKTEHNPTNGHLWLMRTYGHMEASGSIPNWAAHGISDQKYEDQLSGKQ